MEQIKKVIIGPDIKNGFHYSVGQEVSKGANVIVRIEMTEPRVHQLWVMSTDGTKEVKLWKKYEYTLNRAEEYYGVQPQIIVAIVGVETQYGKYKGNDKVMDTLAMAWIALSSPPLYL